VPRHAEHDVDHVVRSDRIHAVMIRKDPMNRVTTNGWIHDESGHDERIDPMSSRLPYHSDEQGSNQNG
jgi:hypothetical protein